MNNQYSSLHLQNGITGQLHVRLLSFFSQINTDQYSQIHAEKRLFFDLLRESAKDLRISARNILQMQLT
jgi:hypothetical protein